MFLFSAFNVVSHYFVLRLLFWGVTAVNQRKKVAKVCWSHDGSENTYRIGREGGYDLAAAPAEPDANNAASMCSRAAWAQHNGAEDVAESLYREALRLDASHGQSLIRCGVLLMKQGRNDEAEMQTSDVKEL